MEYPDTEMDHLNKALEAEAKNELAEAAYFYEKVISGTSSPPISVFINLMFLYFLAQDHGIEVEQNLTIDYMSKAYRRITPLYNQAKALYPENIEVDFWENYIFYRFPYGPSYDEVSENYFNQKKTMVPYFFAYDAESNAYVKEAKELWKEVKDGKTFKERYIRNWIGFGITGKNPN